MLVCSSSSTGNDKNHGIIFAQLLTTQSSLTLAFVELQLEQFDCLTLCRFIKTKYYFHIVHQFNVAFGKWRSDPLYTKDISVLELKDIL